MKKLVLILVLISSASYAGQTCKSHVTGILERAKINSSTTIDYAKSLCNEVNSEIAVKCLVEIYHDDNPEIRPVITEDEAIEINNVCYAKAQSVN